jgi:hypothetical protein
MSIHYPYRRILRRETHSPRSVVAITAAVIVIILCAYVGTEVILAMVGHRALLASPQDMLTALGDLGTAPIGLPIIIGILLVVLGLLLIVAAVTPGRRARHRLTSSRAAVVVDDEVIASSLARSAAHAGNIDPDTVVVSVSSRRATVHVTPTSGVPLREEEISRAVAEQLAGLGLDPPIHSEVRVALHGRVGS